MIGLETARRILDFRGALHALSAEAAEEQLRGAVALHNILEQKRVAYLADEVGMGKTYVALGTLALFRHFHPHFRVLVVAPRANIQKKWLKELRNFVRNNVRFADLRVKAAHGAPARQAVECDSLVELVRETSLNAERDFFVRLTSFSLPVGGRHSVDRYRKALVPHLPWADLGRLDVDLRAKGAAAAFKDAFARAVCAALPRFDLVIVDEGHNLKHGFGPNVSARNRVLALALGHPEERVRGFRGYGRRVERVLFLSATPIENDYAQLWNQLHVFGFGDAAPALVAQDASEDGRRACAQGFLIRRLTALRAGEARLTKNLYRREWRRGGVVSHDDPLEVSAAGDDRQRLAVALVQKKVSELLGHEKFNNSFQIGMLASFESFLETARVKPPAGAEDEPANFDDPEQTDRLEERLGVDVGAVNHLARSYRLRFGKELPHPKMDALVAHLAGSLPLGRKALVFVRRVASVKELQAKLEERYDAWLIAWLQARLPALAAGLSRQFARYQEERQVQRRRAAPGVDALTGSGDIEEEDGGPASLTPQVADTGGVDSFFAWFFRGAGPPGVFSGAALQRRFTQASSSYATFFEDNHVAWLLGVRPDRGGSVLRALASYLGLEPAALAPALLARAERCLPARRSGTVGRLHLFLAFQEAGLTLLAGHVGPVQEHARTILQLLQEVFGGRSRGAAVPAHAEQWLEEPTFFSELRVRPALRGRVWPQPAARDFAAGFREQELRRLFLSAAARLGHAFLDLYVLAADRVGSLRGGAREEDSDDGGLAGAYLDRLEAQMCGSDASAPQGHAVPFEAFHELAAIAEHFELIVQVNAPDLWTEPLVTATRTLGVLFGRQQPIGGMFGQVSPTLVRQFRLPGYPLVLISTDLLQEGEDLHTFCSAVYHYGISWMPSSMEQRIGRIDRVNSHAERRLTRSNGIPPGDAKLQVYYPHLRETVEVLQVQRVLTRMDRFLELMHHDLRRPDRGDNRIDVVAAAQRALRDPAPIAGLLETAFPVRDELLPADGPGLGVHPETTRGLLARFRALRQAPFRRLKAEWEDGWSDNVLTGLARRGRRLQPFTLLLRSLGGRLMLRCVSPIGRGDWGLDLDQLGREVYGHAVQVVVDREEQRGTWLLSTEDEVLLGPPEHDVARVEWLIERVTTAAAEIEDRHLDGPEQGLEHLREQLASEVERAG